MEDWMTAKDRVVERLMYFSARMAEEARVGRIPEFQKYLDERARLFDELQECDQKLAGKPTPLDEVWMRELQQMQKVNEEIAANLKKQQQRAQKEIQAQANLKHQIIVTENIQAKGTELHTQG